MSSAEDRCWNDSSFVDKLVTYLSAQDYLNLARVSQRAKDSILKSNNIIIRNIENRDWRYLEMVLQQVNVENTFNSIVVPLRDMIKADQQSLKVIFDWASMWTIQYHEGGYKVMITNEISWNRLLWLINDELIQMLNS